jgi:hypothetical protein
MPSRDGRELDTAREKLGFSALARQTDANGLEQTGTGEKK